MTKEILFNDNLEVYQTKFEFHQYANCVINTSHSWKTWLYNKLLLLVNDKAPRHGNINV